MVTGECQWSPAHCSGMSDKPTKLKRLQRCPVTGKAMRTESQNNAWLADYRRRRSPGSPKLRGYECEYCACFHVTHIQSKILKRRLKKRVSRSR